MTELVSLRISTDYVNGSLFQAVRHPDIRRSALMVSSAKECFEATWEGLKSAGYYPHKDYLKETKDGYKLIVPTTLSAWSQPSLTAYLNGDLQPVTMREHFEEIKTFIEKYVWLPEPVDLVLAAVSVFISYFIGVFCAVPVLETRGGIGSGKSRLQKVMSLLCRSGVLIATSTIAAVARIRYLDSCSLFFEEGLPHPSHPVVLGTYKRDTPRLVTSRDGEPETQNVYGLTWKVPDGASQALKDRTIYLHTQPARQPLPQFYPERERTILTRLMDHSFWLSLTQFQNVVDEVDRFIASAPVVGRAAEKWAPIIAVARAIDASDPDCAPISPSLEQMMIEQVNRDREERASSDPALLVLAGTYSYVCENSSSEPSGIVSVVAADLTEYLTQSCERSFTAQQVARLLGIHGVLVRKQRTRDLSNCVRPVSAEHAKTVFHLDVERLICAMEANCIRVPEERKKPLMTVLPGLR